MTTPPGPLDYERHALRWILQRLMGEVRNIETLCKYIPRIASTVAALTRAEEAARSGKPSPETDAIRKAIQSLMDETDLKHEEDPQW